MRSPVSARRFGFAVLGLAGLATASTWCSDTARGAGPPPVIICKGVEAAWSGTFEERVAGQRAIEEVRWGLREWPSGARSQRPTLEATLPESRLREKVRDGLLKSAALEQLWGRPITPGQLQAEMERMARQTRRPDILRRIWHALGDEPARIAECLARPVLADRLLRSAFAADERIHGETRRRARAERDAIGGSSDLAGTSGEFNERTLVLDASGATSGTLRLARDGDCEERLAPDRWASVVSELCGLFGENPSGGLEALPVGRPSPLRGDEQGFSLVMVLEREPGRVRLATVQYPRVPFDAWWASTRGLIQIPPARPILDGLTLPEVDGRTCTDDTWETFPKPAENATGTSSIWTGTEMIVWGGQGTGSLGFLNTGGRYDPATDTWAETSAAGAPSARRYHSAVWTGTEMIVWGGVDGSSYLTSGGRYNPSTDTWAPMSTANCPAGRMIHTAVWTGTVMVVWGGYGYTTQTVYYNTGGRYDPAADTWSSTSTGTNCPVGRNLHTAVWTGSVMVIWGGRGSGAPFSQGGRYDPAADTWAPVSFANMPSRRNEHSAVWSPERQEMVVWGGRYWNGENYNTGGRYNPSTDTWTATTTTGAPDIRYGQGAVWTGSEMIVWGGSNADYSALFSSGGRYDPSTDSWTPTTPLNAPLARVSPFCHWNASTGEMIVWGGTTKTGQARTAARYRPADDSWVNIASAYVPEARFFHTAVWTGSEMIVWGGVNRTWGLISAMYGTGGRFDPATSTWTITPTLGAPAGRYHHSAIWTGAEMIVWGGYGNSGRAATGGRYNPASDSWTATSTAGAPTARESHSAVWADDRMVVWGGIGCANPPACTATGRLQSGGEYDPLHDSWIDTPVADAPSGRDSHTALWTGSEMLVWGGYDGASYLRTGGLYDPAARLWTATSTDDAPAGRMDHTAVWAPDLGAMIVWGGFSGVFEDSGGIYNLAGDSWAYTEIDSAPQGRTGHVAAWTGAEMLVWGGSDGTTSLSTGGRFEPVAGSWTPMSTASTPPPRYDATAVWTGSELLVWGGAPITNTGGSYCACLTEEGGRREHP